MSEIKYYPLTLSQSVIMVEMAYCPYKQVANIPMEVEFQQEMDQEKLLEAIKLSMKRNHAASVRLHTDKEKNVWQYFSDAEHNEIEFLDFTGRTEDYYVKQRTKWSQTPFPKDHMDTQLYVVKLVKKPNGKYAFYGCFSHMIYDAYAIMSTFKDICQVYDALVNGKPMPEELPSPLPAYEADYKYRTSKTHEKDMAFLNEVTFATEPQYTTINGADAKEFSKKHKYGDFCYTPTMKNALVEMPIEKAMNDAVNEFALANKVSPQTVYMLAVRTFLAERCNVDDVTIMETVARRSTLAQKRAGGSMASGLYLRTIFGNDLTFRQACEKIYQTQFEVYRHPNVGAGETLGMIYRKFATPRGKTYSSVIVTYQPYFNGEDVPEVEFHQLINGCATTPMFMSVEPFDSKGAICAHYEYMAGVVKEETVYMFHNFLMDFIKNGLAAPDRTVGELAAELLNK